MVDKLISFNEERPGTGLPDVVEQRLDGRYSGGSGGDVGVSLETDTGYPSRPDTPLVIWRGATDPRELPGFMVGVDLWAQTTPGGGGEEGPQVTWFTDFSDDTVGTIPAGWSVNWTLDSVEATLVDDAGDNVFRIGRTQLVSPALTLIQWDDVPEAVSSEIVVRWRGISDGASYIPAAVRTSGALGSEQAYSFGFLNETEMRIRANVGSPALSPVGDRLNGQYVLGEWRWTRLRVEGTTLTTRNWIDGETEPTVWDKTETDTRVEGPGGVGMLVPYQARTMEVSQVGVGIDGASAPVSA